MRRALVLAYGVFAYASFLAVFAVLVDFVADAGVVCGIDRGTPISVGASVAIDVALLGIFGASHSILARPSVKRWSARLLPKEVERSTFVVVANAALALIVWQWRPLPQTIWRLEAPALRAVVWALSASGVVLLVVSTFLTNHFDLFGLRQVWLYARGRPYTPVPFQLRGVYRWVRHPMMVGIVVWAWATPTMSLGHALFALVMSAYAVIGVWFEERDLARELGEPYAAYRKQVGAFVPRLRSSRGPR